MDHLVKLKDYSLRILNDLGIPPIAFLIGVVLIVAILFSLRKLIAQRSDWREMQDRYDRRKGPRRVDENFPSENELKNMEQTVPADRLDDTAPPTLTKE